MKYTVRPISDRTWLRPNVKREGSRFDSTWRSTITLLGREIEQLGGRDIVIEVDVEERHIRQDGMLRADARASSPAVVVAFESKHGPQLHRCDKYISKYSSQGPSWHQNLRAIALTLEALRAVERYGGADLGQQYTGFKAIGAGRAMPASHMTSSDATELLRSYAPTGSTLVDAYKAAKRATHPDHNDGDQARWDRVEQAAAVLGLLR